MYVEDSTTTSGLKLLEVVKYGSGEDATEVLSVAVRRWAGIKGRLGEFDVMDEGHYKSLSNMNDDGHSFEEIANFIEKNWENL